MRAVHENPNFNPRVVLVVVINRVFYLDVFKPG